MTLELTILQLARLRGRPAKADLAMSAGVEYDALDALVSGLVADARVVQANGRVAITPTGRQALAELVAQERLSVDQASLATAYQHFLPFNREFKQLVTDWQLIDGLRPNDHRDSEYDLAVIGRLACLHRRFAPPLKQMVAIAARLAIYPPRFASALERIEAGDRSWVARPLVDSYHTNWFELHEDLIGLLGLSRAEEAATDIPE